MIRRPPRSTRTDTLFPYTTLFRSVSESVLNRIDHPMVGDLLKFRAAQKQLSGFIEGWKPYLDLVGRLHPVFKLHGTVTGRLSCEHPNLQRSEERRVGKECVRTCRFLWSPDHYKKNTKNKQID